MTEVKLYKGEQLEEKIRRFFLRNGLFAIRSLKFAFDGFEITDIDIWLYNRPSFISREITIVDIKNKKTPQAMERIFWTKGLMHIIKADHCIVATTEKRNSVRNFGRINGVTVLDGSFLQKLPEPDNLRLSEEDFVFALKKYDGQIFINEFPGRYDDMKRSLLKPLDFSSCNTFLQHIEYFFEHCITNPQQRVEATRLLYMAFAFFLVVLDNIMKDLSHLDENERKEKLSEGFKYGNAGKIGIQKTLDIAFQLTKQPGSRKKEYLSVYEQLNTEGLTEYFSKIDHSNKLFRQAINFEKISFNVAFVSPLELDIDLRALLSLILDFNKIERQKFFNSVS